MQVDRQACRATTDHYCKWAKRNLAEYEAYIPADAAREAQQNGNNGSDKPRLHVISA
jgi:hypothetical protein